jgi:hypothetical protein
MNNDLTFIKRQAQIFDQFVGSFSEDEEAPTPDLEQLLPEDSCKDGQKPHDYEVNDFSGGEDGTAYLKCRNCPAKKPQ